MKLYREFEEALIEVANNTKETPEFSERFIKMVKNYMNGMNDMSNIDDLIQETILLGEENED